MIQHLRIRFSSLAFLGFFLFSFIAPTTVNAQFTSLYSVPSGTFLQDVVFADTNIMMVTGSSLYRTSIDGGRNWIGLSSGGMSVKAAHFSSKRFGIAVGNAGLYRVNDECGYFWGWGNNVFCGVSKDLQDVYFINDQHGMLCGNDGTLRYSTNQAASFTAIASGITNHINGVWMTNDSVAYACASGGIILKMLNHVVVSSTVLNAAVDLNKIAFIDEQTGYCVGNAGTLYKTTDAGTTWNLIPTGTVQNLLSLAFTSLQHGVITGSNGLHLVTEDAAQTFSVGTTAQTTDIRSVAFKNSLEAYCVGSNFVEYTRDGGHSWMRVDGTNQSVHFPTPDRGYACGYYGVAYKTEDGGNNWKPMNLNTAQYLNDIYFINRDTGFAVGGSSVFRTLDGGETWNTITNPSTTSLYSVHFTDYNHGVAAGYRQTIMYTANAGQTWTISQNSNSTVYNMDIKFPSPQIGYMCTSTGAVLKSVNGGATWTSSSGGSAQLANLFFTDVLTGWAVGNGGLIIHTIDGGATWQTQTSGTTNYLNGVHFLDANRGVVVGSAGTYLITYDGGATWINRTNGSTSNDYTDVYFTDDLHGYAVSGISISGIGPFTNLNPSAPYCPSDNFSFNAFDPYHLPNANSQVVLEMTSINDDFSNAQVLANAVIDSVGLITSAIPAGTPEGLYKTRIRDINNPDKISFHKYLAVSAAPQVSVSAVGNTLTATSNQNVVLQWYGNPNGFTTYLASGPTLTITASGDYYVVAISGCCTTYSTTQHLTVCDGGIISGSTQSLSICSGSSVSVGSSVYTTAGTYSDTLQTAAGCDSVVTSTITVLEADTLEQFVSICEGDSYSIGNSTYTNAGDYADVFVNATFCDSTVITHLSLQANPTLELGGDTLLCDGQQITLSAGEGWASYEWNNGAEVSTITVSSEGTYSVEISNSVGCFASDSIQVTYDFCLSLNEHSSAMFQVFPNPTAGALHVNVTHLPATMRLYNSLGQLIEQGQLTAVSTPIMIAKKGIYWLQVEQEGRTYTQKIVVIHSLH